MEPVEGERKEETFANCSEAMSVAFRRDEFLTTCSPIYK